MKMTTVKTMHRLDQFLNQAMPLLSPLGVVLGVGFADFFILFRPYISWIFAVITLSGALKLRAKELGKAVSSPMPILFFFVGSRIVMPLAIFFLSRLIFWNDPDTVSGYVLLYSVPTAVTGLLWVSIFGGNSALFLTLILLDTALAPLLVPGTVRLLLGTSIRLDMTGMAISLSFMIVIPTVAGIALNEFSRGKIPALVSPYLAPFSKFAIVLLIAANSSGAASQIRPDNPRLWVIIAVCIFFSVSSFMFARFLSRAGKFDREKQISLFFACGLKNIGAAMALTINYFPAAAALPAVLGIIFQQTTAALMGRILLKER